MSLGSEKIVNLLIDSLSIEELEAALERKKGFTRSKSPRRTSKERLREEYRKRLLALGILFPP